MKRRNPLVLVSLAIIGVLAVLLLDPFGWFRGPAQSAIGTSASAPLESPTRTEVAQLAGASSSSELVHASKPPMQREEAQDAPLFEWHIQDPEGLPLPDVRVLMLREESVLLDAFTNGAGVVALAADGLEVEAVLAPPSRPIEGTRLRLEAGAFEYRLNAGSRLSGRVIDEAGLGLPAFALRLDSDQDFPASADISGV